MSKTYGFIYDKQGNYREVSAPTTGTGKPVKRPKKIQTGAIPSGIGFSKVS